MKKAITAPFLFEGAVFYGGVSKYMYGQFYMMLLLAGQKKNDVAGGYRPQIGRRQKKMGESAPATG